MIGRLHQIGYVRPRLRLDRGRGSALVRSRHEQPGAGVQAWMDSAIHRMYLLKPRFDELGVAGSRGTPIDPDQPDGITVAAEFGFRAS